jgi:hypothetical protein
MNQKEGAVSILYGNGAAQQAQLNDTHQHRPREKYTLATWAQVADQHWYGSHINGRLKRVETVSVYSARDGSLVIDYKLVKGAAPKNADGDSIERDDRIRFILDQRAAIFP